MAHTISKQIYSAELKKYLECEVLVLDEEDDLPETESREIILSCQSEGNRVSYGIDSSNNDFETEVEDDYEVTELIDQYSDLDVDKSGY
ncbi:MAG: hypothetical protein WCK67_05660 [bacterium]